MNASKILRFNLNFSDKNIIFFDDECLLCNSIVKIIGKIDKKLKFYYSSNNSGLAKLLLNSDLSTDDYMVFYKKGEIFIADKAVYEIAGILKSDFKVLALVKFIPKIIMSIIYRLIAKNRKIFFKRSKCSFDNEMKNRILN